MATLGPDKSFVSSLQGMLRIAEIVFGVCGIICIESIGSPCYDNYVHRYEFALFVLICSFLLAMFFTVIFVLRSQELMSNLVNFPFLLWLNALLVYLVTLLKGDNVCTLMHRLRVVLLVCDSFSGFFYLIVCLLEFCAYCADPDDNAASKVAGVFGLFAMICFFISSYFSYKFFRDERFPSSFAPSHPGLHAVSVTPSMS